MSGQVQKRNAQLVELMKSEFSNAGGIDPAGHEHSKLVASDGAPDPAIAEDADGELTHYPSADGETYFLVDQTGFPTWYLGPTGYVPGQHIAFWAVALGDEFDFEILDMRNIDIHATDNLNLTAPQTDVSNDLEVGNDLVVMASAEIGGDLEVLTRFSLSPALLQTIAAGVITATSSRIKVETQGGAATDNLDTINNPLDGAILILSAHDDTHDVVVTQAGNIALACGNCTLSTDEDTLTLIYHTAVAKWIEVSRSDCGGGASDIGARAFNNANINIANAGAGQALTYNSERWDTDGIHSVLGNTSRLTCQTAGKYVISTCVRWANNVTGTRITVIKLNGATDLVRTQDDCAGGGDMNQSITTIYDLAVTDFVETFVYQNSGAALNVTVNANYSPEFSMQMIA